MASIFYTVLCQTFCYFQLKFYLIVCMLALFSQICYRMLDPHVPYRVRNGSCIELIFNKYLLIFTSKHKLILTVIPIDPLAWPSCPNLAVGHLHFLIMKEVCYLDPDGYFLSRKSYGLSCNWRDLEFNY